MTISPTLPIPGSGVMLEFGLYSLTMPSAWSMLSITPEKFVCLSHCDSSRGRIKTNASGTAMTSISTTIRGMSIFGDLIFGTAFVLHHRLSTSVWYQRVIFVGARFIAPQGWRGHARRRDKSSPYDIFHFQEWRAESSCLGFPLFYRASASAMLLSLVCVSPPL